MSLYFDYKVQNQDSACININIEWHQQHPLLAVSSYSQDKGGFVTIYDELGEPLPDVNYPHHPVAQVTSLVWHPSKKVLVTGWENGELRAWSGDSEFTNVQSPHQSPITILSWSDLGGRLVSGDTMGSLVGSKLDSRGQVLTVFHHELKEPLTHISFRKNHQKPPGFDISGLARAAVAGDERALDMFSAWRPRTAGQRMNIHAGSSDNLCFFIGSFSGVVYYFTEEGGCTEVLNTDGSLLKKLLYHDRKDNLVIMTEGLNVGQFQVDMNGELNEIMKVKLSGRSQEAMMVWAGPGLLAVTTGDLSIRCWDLDTGENYLLDYTGTSSVPNMPTEIFTSLSFYAQKGILSGGTNLGNIIMWRFCPPAPSLGMESPGAQDPWNSWVRESPASVRGAIKGLSWAHAEPLLAVNTITSVYVLKEQQLCAHYSQNVSAVQISPNQLLVEVLGSNAGAPVHHCQELTTDLQVKGVAVAASHVALWSSKTLVVYHVAADGSGKEAKVSSKVLGTFSCEAEMAFIHDQSVIVMEEERVQIRTFQGTVKQKLTFSENDGLPIGMELCSNFLTIATANGVLKLWDLSLREAKLHTQPKNLEDDIMDFGEIILARSNNDGTKVSITVAKSNFLPDSKLFVWDVESDSLRYFNFETCKLDDQEEAEGQAMSPVSVGDRTPSPNEKKGTSGYDCAGRFVLSHQWDAEEPKLLVCEAKLLPKTSKAKDKPHSRYSRRVSSSTMTMPANSNIKNPSRDMAMEVVLVTFFTSHESGLIIQDALPLPETYTRLLGVHTPHYMLLKKPTDKSTKAGLVKQLVMRDFEGLEASDKVTRNAVLNFSYNLTTGNMDEAFQSIKLIRSEVVWESLARMCVKTKRLDVASVCLGHMKHARGAMALRQAAKEPQLEARVAMLAVQLGLTDEAERLYMSCGRHDLLNQMYQASGEWDKALRVAEEQDRIHLRNTYFNYACHLEAKGDTNGAAHMYERADTHRFQVPRMLLEDPLTLETYMLKSKDPQLVKWWAQYMESSGRMDLAIKYYEEAKDYFSLVRVLCFQENLTQAADIASSTGDKSACYHLARQYESRSRIQEAVHFFSKAQAYGNAIRICKEQGMDEQLWNLALMAGPREQLEAAQYFELSEPPVADKAVLLYHRSGMLHKALDLAFRTQQYNALQLIAVNLNSTSDPALIQKCADFFVDNKQFDKAVDLLAIGKKYEEALALCMEHNIAITEDLADKLTITKGEGSEETRVAVLERVAECATVQGDYHLATKKYTQAGNKVKAMKALLKSGDTEKIVFFANVSRQREIYVMAANYLQSLDWQNNPEVLRNIVSFYSKGRAPELLANFYVACAQVEVDEYQNYEKALGALGEANRCLSKVTTPHNSMAHQKALETLNTRMALIKKFVDIRRLFDRGDLEMAMAQCRTMLDNSDTDTETAVRRGDLYALMVEHRVAAGDFTAAQQLIEEFRRSTPGVNLAYYLGTSMLDKVAKGLGLPVASLAPSARSRDQGLRLGGEEEQQEVVVEEEEEEVEEEEIVGAREGRPYEVMNGRAYAI